jgi:hypothetical protein
LLKGLEKTFGSALAGVVASPWAPKSSFIAKNIRNSALTDVGRVHILMSLMMS